MVVKKNETIRTTDFERIYYRVLREAEKLSEKEEVKRLLQRMKDELITFHQEIEIPEFLEKRETR